jgi:hypothetical protein
MLAVITVAACGGGGAFEDSCDAGCTGQCSDLATKLTGDDLKACEAQCKSASNALADSGCESKVNDVYDCYGQGDDVCAAVPQDKQSECADRLSAAQDCIMSYCDKHSDAALCDNASHAST